MKLKSTDEINDLTGKLIKIATDLLKKEELRVSETDATIDMLFSYFISNSLRSIPENLREEYLQDRLRNLSLMMYCSIEDIPGISIGKRQQIFNA